ncbi:MAG: ATP synthase F1 subunit epsilon [Spirochaetaceae bacterium]|nr:ATP synthase F1 subunit epsilon [Spirochaetaceae bacterium]
MKSFKFEIDTPYRQFFSDEVQAVTLTLLDGDITVYADHSFFTAPVMAGVVSLKGVDGVWKNAFISEGILEVKTFNKYLLVDAAEWPEEIDRERAEKALAAAEETISVGTFRFETAAAEAAARRARYRIKVADLS